MVTSPTSRRARGESLGRLGRTLRASLVGALLVGVTLGTVPDAAADDLSDSRAKVRKALVQTRKEVTADKKAVNQADSQLDSSRAKLAKARSELAHVRKRLAAAKAADAKVAAELKVAEAALETAAAAVRKAEAAIEQQEVVVGVVVRSAYQQHTNLIGLTVIVGSGTAAELAQRVQWSTTLFDSSTAQLDRLEALRVQLQEAKAARQAAEAALASKRAETAQNLAKVRALSAEAASKEAAVARLVAAKAKAKAEAQDELEQSEAEYKALQRQEARIAAKLRNSGYNVKNRGGFIRPVNASAGSPFGLRYHPILHYWRMHWGTDFGAACGAPLRAMANGRVVSAGWTSYGFGNYTVISYGRVRGASVASGYAHQSRVVVRAGETVKQGQIVGYVGSTGLSTGCHLHLQMYRNGARVNPMRYL